MDRKKEQIERYQYDFDRERAVDAGGLVPAPRLIAAAAPPVEPGDRSSPTTRRKSTWRMSRQVREGMRRGDYYEVVLRQTFRTPYCGNASDLFERIQKASPSPYEFLLQFGDEQLIGASPEMFVRVEGARVETCPISGTARRTGDPLRDADEYSRAAQLDKGRVRVDHVHGRGPQRQVARL